LVHLVILAAGRGTRLREWGESRQKWLLDVGGATLADRQLDGARRAGVASIRVVTGHAAEGVEGFLKQRGEAGVELLHNPEYDRLNNWFSVLLALRAVPDGDGDRFVVFNSDLCARPDWFAAFLLDAAATPHESLVAVDTERALTDESMKVAASDGDPRLLQRIAKRDVEGPIGEYVGMFMARAGARRDLRVTLEGFVGSEADADHWYEGAIGVTAARRTPWVVWPTPDGDWVEIDDAADHDAARRLGIGG
jgi:choline kinase